MKKEKKTSNPTTLHLGNISGVKAIADDYSQMGEDFIFTRMTVSTAYRPAPIRSDMLTIFLCRKGSFSISINLNDYDVKSGDILIIPPGSILKTENVDMSTVEGDFLFISPAFANDLNFDLNDMDLKFFINERRPLLELTDQQFEIMSKFLDLVYAVTIDYENKPFFVRVIARNILNATFYQIMQFAMLNAQQPAISTDLSENGTAVSRRANYMGEFLKLVRLHFRTERSINFYADKLFISPKYLSLVIKEVTGRTAVSWINDFVIFEAKALLRFSGKNIQQIAYELSFPNQSSFGKYFKQRTGMSPSQFKATY